LPKLIDLNSMVLSEERMTIKIKRIPYLGQELFVRAGPK